MTFRRRRIDLTFQLGQGAFGEDGSDTVMVQGLRVTASIRGTSGPGLGELQLRVYGLTPSLLHQLSALNQGSMAARNNRIIVSAGDDAAGMATVFNGQMTLGQILLNEAPASALLVTALAGALNAVQTAPPSSYPGTADAAVIMANLATQMGMGFENNGVSVLLSTPYFAGSPREQALRCVKSAGIHWTIDEKKNVLAIWPEGGSRGGDVPLISADSGMVGYPSYSSGINGLAVTTEFNPLLRIGGKVQIKSGLEVANGTWYVFDLGHELESESPGGQWFTHFNASASAPES